MKDNSLTVYKEKRISIIIKFFKNLFIKQPKEELPTQNIQLEVKNEIDDFELLKKLMEGKIDISEIDNESKKRLISICNNRLDGVKKQIRNKKNEIKQMEDLLADINALQMDNV